MSLKRASDTSVSDLKRETETGASNDEPAHDVQAEIERGMREKGRPRLTIKRRLQSPVLKTNFFDVPTTRSSESEPEAAKETAFPTGSSAPTTPPPSTHTAAADPVDAEIDAAQKSEVSHTAPEPAEGAKDESPASGDAKGKTVFSLDQSLPQSIVSTPFKPVGDENECHQPTDQSPLVFASEVPRVPTVEPVERSKPSSFPGEEDENVCFSDYNVTLLKCNNVAGADEKPVYKYQTQGHGVCRVLQHKVDGSKRLIFRQAGTWKVFLNSPLSYVERVERVSSFSLKFTAAESSERLAAYCFKFTETQTRDECEKHLTEK